MRHRTTRNCENMYALC